MRNETIRVCAFCDEEVKRVGPDYLDYCENCSVLEGPIRSVALGADSDCMKQVGLGEV